MDSHLQEIRDRLTKVTAGMTVADLARHPEGKWCAGEVLEHLSLTYSATARALQKCLDTGQSGATKSTVYQRLGTFLITRLGIFPGGRQAPEIVRPKGVPPETVLPTLLVHLSAMDRVLAQCEEKFGRSCSLGNHPVLGPLTVHQWRRFHLIHARHHAAQVERLRPPSMK